MTTTDTTARIVVGVDGSPGSKTALTWAMTQARLTGATVEAVTTWQDPVMYGYGYGWAPVALEGDSIATIMDKVLDETITEVSGQLGRPGHRPSPGRRRPSGAGAARRRRRRADARGRQPRTRHLRRDHARLGQPALRAARTVPGRRRPAE